MKKNLLKKFLTGLITAVILLNPLLAIAQDSNKGGSVADESLQDLTIVVATGAVGAVLGLSTLSFVDTPKEHLKNIAIGGALGIVVGVGLVIFNQASKSAMTVADTLAPLTPETSEGLARSEFSKQRIAENYLMQPTVAYNFTF
ncbi:MAG: hypothetical protein H7336_16030 [Bacteriovorax sp.]|nr:hypothetical protein [Bacteriovorax sp.]